MTATPPVELIEIEGLVSYGDGLALLRRIHAERVAGTRPDALILLEHKPVITLGKNAKAEGVAATPEALAARGVEVFRVERGGEATMHLPGQLVAYPVLNLRERGLGVKRYVHLLEEAMISAAAAFGVAAHRLEGVTGVWCDSGKIGAVGVAVKGGVTLHGIAFNVACDLGWYELIIPCGRADLRPSSLAASSGSDVTMSRAREALLSGIFSSFGA